MMEEDFNSYPLLVDEMMFMSGDINPYNFKYALLYEDIFPLGANFIKSLISDKDLLEYLTSNIFHDIEKHEELDGWVFSKEEIKNVGKHSMIIIFLLYYQPESWQTIAFKIYNMNYELMKPTIEEFIGFMKS